MTSRPLQVGGHSADESVNAARKLVRRVPERDSHLAAPRSSSGRWSSCSGARSQLMPRVKPTSIEPSSKSAVTWNDVAGVDEAAAELTGGRRLPARPAPLRAARRARTEGNPALRARPGRGRRCSRRRSPTRRARASTLRALPRSSRCSPVSAPRASASSSTPRGRNQPAIVFIDELDAVGMRRSGPRVQPRARPDAEPAPRRARRLRRRRRGRRHRRLEPARGPRPGSAAAGPLRPADPRLPPDLGGREAILQRAHARQAAGSRTSI